MLSLTLPALVLCFACVLADQQPSDSCDTENDGHALLQQQLMADDGRSASAASEDEDSQAVDEQEPDNSEKGNDDYKIEYKPQQYWPAYHPPVPKKKCKVHLPEFDETIDLKGKVLELLDLTFKDHELMVGEENKAKAKNAEVTFHKPGKYGRRRKSHHGHRRRKSHHERRRKSHSSLFITKVWFEAKDAHEKKQDFQFVLLCSLDVPIQKVYYPGHGECIYQTAKCNSGAYTIKKTTTTTTTTSGNTALLLVGAPTPAPAPGVELVSVVEEDTSVSKGADEGTEAEGAEDRTAEVEEETEGETEEEVEGGQQLIQLDVDPENSTVTFKDIASGDITWELGDDCEVTGLRVRVWGQDSVDVPMIQEEPNGTQIPGAVFETYKFREDCSSDLKKIEKTEKRPSYGGEHYAPPFRKW